MGSVTPPQEIAQDWTTWTGFLDLVISETAVSTDPAAVFPKVHSAQQTAQPSSDKLKTYWSQHCKK